MRESTGSKDNDLAAKARAYAFLLLKFRLRSEKELYLRLRKKKFEPRVIEQTISFLKEKGFINDRDFAKVWAESRIKNPFGLRRIRDELKLKGIDKAIIDAQISQIKEDYREEDIVLKIAEEKYKKLKTSLGPQKAKLRIYGYLMRRGFSPETIIEALRKL